MPARCELCRHSCARDPKKAMDEELLTLGRTPLVCNRILDRRDIPDAPMLRDAVVEYNGVDLNLYAQMYLAVAPSFCCSLFEPKQ